MEKKKSNIYHFFFFHITMLYSFHETSTEQTSELCFTLRKRRQITHSTKKCTTRTFWGRPRFGWDFSFCLFLKQFLPHPTHIMFSTCSSWPLNRRRRRCSGNDQSNLWQQQSAWRCAATSRDFLRKRLQSAFTLANQLC